MPKVGTGLIGQKAGDPISPIAVNFASVRVTSAQLLLCDDTHFVEVLPAVPNKTYVILQSLTVLNFKTTAYTNAAGTVLVLGVPGIDVSVDNASSWDLGGLQLNPTQSFTVQSLGSSSGAPFNPLSLGASVNLYGLNGALTLGDGDLDILIWYVLY